MESVKNTKKKKRKEKKKSMMDFEVFTSEVFIYTHTHTRLLISPTLNTQILSNANISLSFLHICESAAHMEEMTGEPMMGLNTHISRLSLQGLTVLIFPSFFWL